MKRILLGGIAAAALSCALAAPAHAALTGTVGGWSNPINNPINPTTGVPEPRTLDVHGRDTTGRLAGASLSVDGVQIAFESLCPANTTTNCQAETAYIPFDTKHFIDGIHHVVVTITDDQGAVFAPLDSDIEFHNALPDNHPVATLEVGGGGTTTVASRGGGSSGGVAGVTKSSCTSPELSMFLSQKPLRISNGVAVLLKGKSYGFSGRLTCVIDRKRRSAPKGARVAIDNVVRGRTVHVGHVTVASGGKLAIKLAYASSRTIEFRYVAADGKTSKVRIKVRIAQTKG
jgi:hypothetical protein